MADRIKLPPDLKSNLGALLRTPPPPADGSSTRKETIAAVRRARKRFAAAHKKGMTALREHDYATLNEVIKEESAIIREQSLPMELSTRKQKPKAKKRR